MRVCCPNCHTESELSERSSQIIRFGQFKRKHDQKWIQRFFCKVCKRSFSTATSDPHFRQRKPELNSTISKLLCSKVSQRRVAWLLGINRKTVVRKFLLMGMLAKLSLSEFNRQFPRCNTIEFDDLETFEHTKLKPVSVTIAVEYKTRRILGFATSCMPAKGHLARRSVRKYGPRPDKRAKGRKLLFESLKPLLSDDVVIRSDQNPHYGNDVKANFPQSTHQTFPGRKSSNTGYGEIKKGGFDPLFSLNHTYAMYRDNINRLGRKTWCTTKKIERLDLHIALYSFFHNLRLEKLI